MEIKGYFTVIDFVYLGLNCRVSSKSSGIDSKSIMPIGSILPLIVSIVKFRAAVPPTMVYLVKK